MYIHALVTIVLERAWAALKCDQLPVPRVTLYQNCSNRSALLNKMAARAKNRKTFKRLLLLNQKMDFEIIIQKCFLGDPLLR